MIGNKLRPPTRIGCPHHGLCFNDTFQGVVPAVTVATRPAGATFGPNVPIDHPAKPGGGDSTWRDFGAYIGHTRSVNGADGGVGLGGNRWLYCDTSGATWIMRFEYSIPEAYNAYWDEVMPTGVLEVEVWLDGLFGRFGRDYSMTPVLMDSFSYTVPAPSWSLLDNTHPDFAAFNAAKPGRILMDFVPPDHIALALSADGSEVFFNATVTGNQAFSVYWPSLPAGNPFANPGSIEQCVFATLKITISGSSAPGAAGVGLTVTIAKERDYEGELCPLYVYDTPTDTYETNVVLYQSTRGNISRNWYYDKATGDVTGTVSVYGTDVDIGGTVPAPDYSSGNAVYVFAQNAVFVMTYREEPEITGNEFIQRWYGVEHPSQAVRLADTFTSYSTHVAGDALTSEFPYTRRVVASFPAINPFLIEVDVATYQTLYAGVTFQWI